MTAANSFVKTRSPTFRGPDALFENTIPTTKDHGLDI